MSSENDHKLHEVVAAVTRAARADGKITEEEAELLEAVQVNVLIYEQALEDAMEDNIITDEEKDILDGLKQQILADSWDVAKLSEGNISDDELKMLEVILRKIEESSENA